MTTIKPEYGLFMDESIMPADAGEKLKRAAQQIRRSNRRQQRKAARLAQRQRLPQIAKRA